MLVGFLLGDYEGMLFGRERAVDLAIDRPHQIAFLVLERVHHHQRRHLAILGLVWNRRHKTNPLSPAIACT